MADKYEELLKMIERDGSFEVVENAWAAPTEEEVIADLKAALKYEPGMKHLLKQK